MSSAQKNENLRAILAARYDLECCDDAEKAHYLKELNRLLDEVLEAKPSISRYSLLEALLPEYEDYRAGRRRAQRRRLST